MTSSNTCPQCQHKASASPNSLIPLCSNKRLIRKETFHHLVQTKAQLPESSLAKQQEHPSTDQANCFLPFFTRVQPSLLLMHHHTTYNLVLLFLQTFPTFWLCWYSFTWPPNSPAGNAFFHSPSQDQPTLLEPVSYITALSFMQVLPQKWLLLEAAEWQNRINEKEGWSTAICHFKSTCAHKTKLTGWRAPVFCQGFK